FFGTAKSNFLPSSSRNQIVADVNSGVPLIPNLPPDSNCNSATNILNCLVSNPFVPLFDVTNPNHIFNEPESIYNDAQIPLINLLRPYPQFDGAFSGLTRLSDGGCYTSLRVRSQRRRSHYLSFEGNYTFS